MYFNDRVCLSKTYFALFFVTLFVLCSIGFGVIPKAYAFETDSVEVAEDMSFTLSADTNENIMFHFSINGTPLTWNDFKNNQNLSLKIQLNGANRFLTYIHDDDSYLARDISSEQVESGIFQLVVNWDKIITSTNGTTPENLDDPVRFMIKGVSSQRTFTGSIIGYEIPDPPKTGIALAVDEGSKMLINIIDIVFKTITSNPLLLIVYSISLVGLMLWLYKFLRV